MNFNGARLRIARLFKGLTQRDVAERVAVSHTVITDYEKGRSEPKGDILDALAAVLDVQPEFFFAYGEEELREEESNFRKSLTASQRLKKKALAHATLFGIVIYHLRQDVEFPAFNIPDAPVSALSDVEQVAEQCRRHWGLGTDTPIHSMVNVLENAGVIVVRADVEIATKIDAFSSFGDLSVVVLNTAKGSTSRSFFDTAHELAHGVLHRSGARKPLELREAEADAFAGAFLMPRSVFAAEFYGAGRTDWGHLIELKRRWGVSLAAIIYRSYKLGIIDAAEYRTRFRYLAKRGWRTDEPEEPEADEPQLLRLAVEQFARITGKTTADLASELGWSSSLFESVTGIAVERTPDASIVSLTDRLRRQVS